MTRLLTVGLRTGIQFIALFVGTTAAAAQGGGAWLESPDSLYELDSAYRILLVNSSDTVLQLDSLGFEVPTSCEGQIMLGDYYGAGFPAGGRESTWRGVGPCMQGYRGMPCSIAAGDTAMFTGLTMCLRSDGNIPEDTVVTVLFLVNSGDWYDTLCIPTPLYGCVIPVRYGLEQRAVREMPATSSGAYDVKGRFISKRATPRGFTGIMLDYNTRTLKVNMGEHRKGRQGTRRFE